MKWLTRFTGSWRVSHSHSLDGDLTGSRTHDLHSFYYVRKQMLLSARLTHRNSVRPSVCLSHRWISQKRCKIGSPNLHRRLPGRL